MDAADSRCYIGVFDSDGQWLYGYSFFCHGSFAIEWARTENITIYWERSSVSGMFDAQANCIELVKWRDDKAWSQRMQALSCTERIVDGTRYVLDASFGILTPLATGYSRVLRYAEDGQAVVVVDTHGGNIVGALGVLGGIVFLVVVMIVVHKRQKNRWKPL